MVLSTLEFGWGLDMSDQSLSPDLFLPVPSIVSGEKREQITISYWQATWIKLKKNKKALLSLNIIIALILTTFVGPLVWTVDPAAQDLEQISQPPSWPRTAIMVDDFSVWPGAYPETGNGAEKNSALAMRVVGEANTEYVRLTWMPVSGASEYHIYRNVFPPLDVNTLGIPLAEVSIAAEGAVGYEDRLKLSEREYYYSVLAVGYSGIGKYSTITVSVKQGITRSDAEFLGLRANSASTVIELLFHPLGTDGLGRDILSRLMHGARTSLMIGVIAPLIYIALGVFYGGLSGYLGGRVDELMMRFSDFVIALPFLLFMILLKVAFGIGPGESGVFPMIVALILLGWPSAARLVRGQTFVIKEEAYVDAALLMGAKPLYIVYRHVLPNVLPLIIVSLTFAIPATIFTEAFLSFIGFGVVPPTPSWGSMCNDGLKNMMATPHELIFPAAVISVSVLCFNLLGDGLREAMDVKYKA